MNPPSKPPEGALVSFTKIDPQPVRFLLWPYLPEGKLCVLEGEAGGGKTWIAAQVAAWVTQGMYGRTAEQPLVREAPGTALFLNSAENPREVLRQRLALLNAVPERPFLHQFPRTEEQKKEGEGNYLPSAEEIAGIVGRCQPKFLVIDRIEDFLEKELAAGGIEGIRRFSRKLAHLAEKRRCTILCLRRRSRRKGMKNAAEAFDAAASSVLIASQDPDDPERRLLAHLYSPYTALGTTLVHGWDEEKKCFKWVGFKDMAAREILGAPARSFEYGRAEELLRGVLGDGIPFPAADLLAEAARRGIGKKALYRAKNYLQIVSRQMDGYWVWVKQEDETVRETPERSEPHLCEKHRREKEAREAAAAPKAAPEPARKEADTPDAPDFRESENAPGNGRGDPCSARPEHGRGVPHPYGSPKGSGTSEEILHIPTVQKFECGETRQEAR